MLHILHPPRSSISHGILGDLQQIGRAGDRSPKHSCDIAPDSVEIDVLGPDRCGGAVLEADGRMPRHAANEQRQTLKEQKYAVGEGHGLLDPGVHRVNSQQ